LPQVAKASTWGYVSPLKIAFSRLRSLDCNLGFATVTFYRKSWLKTRHLAKGVAKLRNSRDLSGIEL
jgi:hypothetical protein